MVKYVLHYFKFRGRAEYLRYAFLAAGVPFEDRRIPMEEWPALKAKMPNGQVPVLEVDGEYLPQTNAIMRYLAREFKLAGKTPEEKTQVDIHCENVQDVLVAFLPAIDAIMKHDEAGRKTLTDKFMAEVWPKFSTRYEAAVATKSGFLVGDSVTVADLFLGEMLERFNTVYVPGVLDSLPKMKAYAARIHEIPGIKKYAATRTPEMNFI